MTRLRLLALAGLCLLAAAAATVPWPVSPAVMRDEVAPQIGRLAGMAVTQPGRATFTLLPVPRVEMSGVALAGGGASLEVPRVRARARLLPLVGGRIEVTEVSLFSPTLATAETAGAGPVLGLLDGLFGTGAEGFVHPALERVSLIGGSLIQRDAAGLASAAVTGLNLVATRAGTPRTVDLEAELQWRGQSVSLDATGFDLGAVLRGPTARLTATARTPLGAVAFDGQVLQDASRGWQADGQINASSPAMDRLAAWLDLTLPVPLAGSATLSARTRLTPDGLALDGLRVALPAGTFEGVLALRAGEGAPSISGTLASDRVDIEKLMAGLPEWRASDGGWNRDILDPAALPRGDVDLRFSAGRVVAGPVNLGNAAVSVLSRAGRTDVALANAQIFKGDVRGKLSVNPSPRGLDMKLSVAVERADAAALLQSLTPSRRLTGLLTGSVQVESSGDSVHALMRAMEGRSTVSVRQGDIVGINLPELLRRVEKRPLLTALDVRGGRTPFEFAHATMRISRGIVEVSEGLVQSPATRVTLGGQIGLAERQLAVTGAAQLADGPEGLSLPFDLTGTFDDPVIQPDARSLIRRSGAAAPFFGRPLAVQGND